MSRGLCVCSKAKVIISVRTGSAPLGLRSWWWWWASRRCFTQVVNTDRHGPFKGSYTKWGCSASAVQLAFRQPCSHSYSALSFQYRLPLLTSLIAFTEPRIRLWWVNKNTLHCQTSQVKISSGKWRIALYLLCIMLHIHLSLSIVSRGLWQTMSWIL